MTTLQPPSATLACTRTASWATLHRRVKSPRIGRSGQGQDKAAEDRREQVVPAGYRGDDAPTTSAPPARPQSAVVARRPTSDAAANAPRPATRTRLRGPTAGARPGAVVARPWPRGGRAWRRRSLAGLPPPALTSTHGFGGASVEGAAWRVEPLCRSQRHQDARVDHHPRSLPGFEATGPGLGNLGHPPCSAGAAGRRVLAADRLRSQKSTVGSS